MRRRSSTTPRAAGRRTPAGEVRRDREQRTRRRPTQADRTASRRRRSARAAAGEAAAAWRETLAPSRDGHATSPDGTASCERALHAASSVALATCGTDYRPRIVDGIRVLAQVCRKKLCKLWPMSALDALNTQSSRLPCEPSRPPRRRRYLNVSPNTLRAWERRFGYPTPMRTRGQAPSVHARRDRRSARRAEGGPVDLLRRSPARARS